MHDSFGTYSTRTLQSLNRAIVNIAVFLPYYFSVIQLMKTLFSPWKNIRMYQDRPGFSLQELGEKLADSFASRFIGFLSRVSILLAFLVFTAGFIIILPFLYISILLFLPLSYLFYIIQPTPGHIRQLAFQDFLKRHLVDEKNRQKVIEWFQIYYQNSQRKPWWSKEQLMNQPPLGRGLTAGFTNTLDRFSTELTLQQPHHKHLIGRKTEIETIQRILSKSSQANVLLNGEVGVGKQAIIEALAKSIYEGSCPDQLAYKRMLAVDMEAILALESDFVKRQDILSNLFREAENAGNIILVIYNFDKYIASGEDHVDLTQVFERYALSESLHLMATTTPYMYQKYVFPNTKVSELFDKVDIPEMGKDSVLRILLDIAPDFEKRYQLFILYDALEETIRVADRYLTHLPFPEKAIELLDEACVYVKSQKEHGAVDGHVIHTVLQQKTHAPIELTDSLKTKLLTLEDRLHKRVLFQDHALQMLSAALRKSFIDLGNRKKPLASFLFLGPTGVGKTETAKAVTEAFFDREEKMIRFDMSNYQSQADIPTLIGSSTTHEPGQLTEAIRNEQYGTLLLDELEKAHHDLINIFLTVLDEGYFTDGFGKWVDCTNLIIIATSNAGADFIYSSVQQGVSVDTLQKTLIDHLISTGKFAPEFLNRFDGVVVYSPLYKEAIIQIALKVVREIIESTQQKYGMTVQVSDTFLHRIVDQGYDPRFGARDLRRLIQESIEDIISKEVLAGTAKGKTLSF